jgi:hypothetical protein
MTLSINREPGSLHIEVITNLLSAYNSASAKPNTYLRFGQPEQPPAAISIVMTSASCVEMEHLQNRDRVIKRSGVRQMSCSSQRVLLIRKMEHGRGAAL